MPRCYFCKIRHAITPEGTWVREDDHAELVPMCHTPGRDCWTLHSIYQFGSPEQVNAAIESGKVHLRQHWSADA